MLEDDRAVAVIVTELDAVIVKLEEVKRQLVDSEMEAQRLAAKQLKHNACLRELSEKTEAARKRSNVIRALRAPINEEISRSVSDILGTTPLRAPTKSKPTPGNPQSQIAVRLRPRPQRFLPQSSSASRFTAGAAGFLILSQ